MLPQRLPPVGKIVYPNLTISAQSWASQGSPTRYHADCGKACYYLEPLPGMSSNPSHLRSLAQAKALASPVRQTVWHLVTILAPVTPKALQEHMGLERHALYYHLRILEECELVTKVSPEGGGVAYITEAEDIFLDQQDNEEWQAVRRQIALTGFRRLSNRLETALNEGDDSESTRKYLSGFMTLFLTEASRKLLHERLDTLWEDLVKLQDLPKDGAKPYFLAFGFAPESYGQE